MAREFDYQEFAVTCDRSAVDVLRSLGIDPATTGARIAAMECMGGATRQGDEPSAVYRTRIDLPSGRSIWVTSRMDYCRHFDVVTHMDIQDGFENHVRVVLQLVAGVTQDGNLRDCHIAA